SRHYRADVFQEHATPWKESEPYFDTSVSANVTGLVGKTVELLCKVKNLGNRTVSWVRHRDIHLLTVGRYTYTSDQRFEATHKFHGEEWKLCIRYPQEKDSGVYECQISTTPPIGHRIHLTVVGRFRAHKTAQNRGSGTCISPEHWLNIDTRKKDIVNLFEIFQQRETFDSICFE
ncbi:hypothetical protein EAI_07832, partial [Harpegnathos saltator]